MIASRALIGAAAAVCVVAAVDRGFVFAADSPHGLDPRELELGRPVTIMPNVTPMSPLPLMKDSAPVDGAERGNPLWGISIESLHATRERPLFSPSRRPPMPAVTDAPPVEPTVATAPPPEPEGPALNLLGLVIGGGEGYAVFISNTTHDIIRLKTGEGEGGWILRSVTDHQAVLERNNRAAVIRMPSATGDQK